MEGLTINIGWEYFLGIIAALIGVAWYSNGRFTKLETIVELIQKALNIGFDNEKVKAFGQHSPVNLTEVGKKLLNESGIKDYLDSTKDEYLSLCKSKKETNPYEVQSYIFELFDKMIFPADIDEKIKKYAFDKGISVDILRRIGAIYFRDICLADFGMKKEDVDKHDPKLNND